MKHKEKNGTSTDYGNAVNLLKAAEKEAMVVERPPIHDLIAAIQQEAEARENAAAAEFNVVAAEICQKYGVRMRVGLTTWDDGEVTGQVQFVSVGIPQN